MITIKLSEKVGSFAENKDIARDLRLHIIVPALDSGDQVIIDFDGIDTVTQSFVHALISDIIRKYGAEILDRISFKGCNETVKKLISIVVEYMQET